MREVLVLCTGNSSGLLALLLSHLLLSLVALCSPVVNGDSRGQDSVRRGGEFVRKISLIAIVLFDHKVVSLQFDILRRDLLLLHGLALLAAENYFGFFHLGELLKLSCFVKLFQHG